MVVTNWVLACRIKLTLLYLEALHISKYSPGLILQS